MKPVIAVNVLNHDYRYRISKAPRSTATDHVTSPRTTLEDVESRRHGHDVLSRRRRQQQQQQKIQYNHIIIVVNRYQGRFASTRARPVATETVLYTHVGPFHS